MMPVNFTCDLTGTTTPITHFWEHTVGSGHATLALRADWQAQLRRAHDELGFRHVRFHGLLCDDVGTLVAEGDTLFYSFFNADQIFDFLLSIGMKPFVELSFMPTALASADQTAFHYRANVSRPKNYENWSTLIQKLVSHWVDRYGLTEVKKWFFEVWNEPNLKVFGSGNMDEYFELYRHTAVAIKSVDKSLMVGGPATAENEWIEEFIAFCASIQMPPDFVSTHHYPTDAFGKPDDDTQTQLAQSHRSVLREEAREVRRKVGNLPLYYTEWCTSSNPRDTLHDETYAAAFIVKTILEANGLVQGYSYWTFSDIFEENYFPSVPFHGGFGLLNIHGIAKPAYRAFELLHSFGHHLLPTLGSHPTVDVWVAQEKKTTTVLLTNFALPRHPITTEIVQIRLSNARSPSQVTIRRIDADHANPKQHWLEMGSPDYLTADNVGALNAASTCQSQLQLFEIQGDIMTLELTLPPQAVAAITIEYASSVS